MRRVGVVSAALFAALIAVAPAAAQVPDLPPIGGGPGVPAGSATVYAAEGEATTYGANPSGTGEVRDPAVFGPLFKLWEEDLTEADRPLVAGGLVIVSSRSRVQALDPRTGKTVWAREGPTAYEGAAIAAGDGRVIAVSPLGLVYAFSIADGTTLWTAQVENPNRIDGPPVVADGRVVLWGQSSNSDEGTLTVLSAADGAQRWQRTVPVSGQPLTGAGGMPAVDDRRVFVVDSCGEAAALALSDGRLLWNHELAEGCSGADAIVYENRLLNSGFGTVYNASTGAREHLLPSPPEAAGAGLAFGEFGGVRAYALDSGGLAWERALSGGSNVPGLLLVGGTLYTVAGERMYALERSTGEVITYSRVGEDFGDARDGGLTAGAGLLLVSNGERVTAFKPVLDPGAEGMAIAASKFDVVSGGRVLFAAGLGSALRERGRPVELHAEPLGRGSRRAVAASSAAYEDGTAYLDANVERNTSFRAAIPGGPESPALKVFAYPRYRVGRGHLTGGRQAVVKTKVLKVPAAEIRGLRLFTYFGARRFGRYKRLGSAKVSGRGERSVARVRFRVPRELRGGDFFSSCVKGMPRAGYGRNDPFARSCGKKIARLPKPRASSGQARGAPVAGGLTGPGSGYTSG